MMDPVERNAEIVAHVKARKMPMREIAARYGLSVSSISLIAIQHGVHARAIDPEKLRAASEPIKRGMPLTHVADTVGLNLQRLRHLLEKKGLYSVHPPSRLWSEEEVRVLRRYYGRAGHSVRSRTELQVSSKAARLGLSWPLEFRVSARPAGSSRGARTRAESSSGRPRGLRRSTSP
jgi:hypothetical protein